MPRLKRKWMAQSAPVVPVIQDNPCPEFPDIQTAIKCSGFTEGQLRGMIKRGEKREGKLHIFREDLKKLMEKKAREFSKAA